MKQRHIRRKDCDDEKRQIIKNNYGGFSDIQPCYFNSIYSSVGDHSGTVEKSEDCRRKSEECTATGRAGEQCKIDILI